MAVYPFLMERASHSRPAPLGILGLDCTYLGGEISLTCIISAAFKFGYYGTRQRNQKRRVIGFRSSTLSVHPPGCATITVFVLPSTTAVRFHSRCSFSPVRAYRRMSKDRAASRRQGAIMGMIMAGMRTTDHLKARAKTRCDNASPNN